MLKIIKTLQKQVKDQSIVKLTNQLHEVELAAKIDQVPFSVFLLLVR